MRNRWLIALAAVGIHISIGSVYAFSVLVKPIMEALGASMADVTWTFSLAILFLGTSAGLLGRTVEKMGPRNSGTLAACLFGAGMIGTSYAVTVKSLPLLYLFYGVIGGMGLGTGYITPVSTLVKYFPKHRGFATGLAIMGFGFAALIAAPVMQYLYSRYGLAATFRDLGIVYFAVMLACSLYLKPPTVQTAEGTQAAPAVSGFTAAQAMRTWQFASLWWVFFINITCGIGLLAVLSPMAQQVIGMSAVEAASFVGIIGIMNGGGRILWSTISDRIGRPITYVLFFALEIAAFALLAGTTAEGMFKFLVLLIISCYGGGFSCMPAYLSDLFGTKQLSAIHGRVLTAWGIAGVVGPTLVSWFYKSTGTYSSVLIFFAGCFIPNLLIALYLRKKGHQLPQIAAD
ncbi:MAG: OFA family MFS transporter [Acidaminococcus sp.]|jgi:OFA family oxalate/formate antiporter-like MFS transporter|nr:OFA family MFS transporter [Acidaminococcus sp.]MCI2099519.1 OFA family MFS transporter [Acidaminococcus sp.]MCI2113604.1 OFA family MFS transporter [Acidaminococcus sp.]MCI2115687.1 OFA family MFS transporter [Acidaminococcus sp.]